jgi:hypothetical protein
MKKGDWYNAKQIEDTVDTLTETTGLLGFTPTSVPTSAATRRRSPWAWPSRSTMPRASMSSGSTSTATR